VTAAARTDRAALRARRAVLPAAILAAAGASAVLLQVAFDPFRQHVPLCLVNSLTGLECPGCGATRAVHALLDGDLPLALQNNALVILAIPVVVALLVRWAVRRARGITTAPPAPSRGVVLAVLALTAVYTVARNLPGFAFLAPTSLVGA